MTAALVFPCDAAALSIGEPALYSGVGEPLLARVELNTGSNEHIEDTCLSLLMPEPSQEDAGTFLTAAKLSFKTNGTQQYVEIGASEPLSATPIRFRLQIKCPSTRGIIKTLTLSPSAPTVDKQANLPLAREHESGDESGNSKINTEEFALLLTQQKLLVDGFLSVQQQLKQLQDELGEIKSQLALLKSSQSTPAATELNTSVAQQPLMQLDNVYLAYGLIAALGLGLTALILWLGLRIYSKRSAPIESGTRQNASPVGRPIQQKPVSPGIKQPSKINSPPPSFIAPSSKSGDPQSAPASLPAPPPKAKSAATEEDSMMEEAQLYAANGRLTKAVEITLEIIRRCPSKITAWTLLLSLYSSLGKAGEFEYTAREFLKRHQASPQWGEIQMLGRTLDQDNPLYADHSGRVHTLPRPGGTLDLHHPIGDILIDMGALSEAEVLKYLKEFDPKKHGRFGGYLVARKAITLAQLDLALLQQQGVHTEDKPGTLPSLQDIEKFLEKFDPKQHGSVDKFMASHNATTPEQLTSLLQHQSHRDATVTTNPTGTPAATDKGFNHA